MAKKVQIEGAGQDQIIQAAELQAVHMAVQKEIIKLAWSDDNLREELAKNPKKVLKEKLGIEFEKGINVNIIDEDSANTIHYTIPHKPGATQGVEFTDEQLDAIAGGMNMGQMFGALSQVADIMAPKSGASAQIKKVGQVANIFSGMFGKPNKPGGTGGIGEESDY